MKKFMILMMAFLYFVPVQARYHFVDSTQEAERYLEQYPYNLLCLYDSRPAGKRMTEQQRDQVKYLKDDLRSLSRSYEFKDLLKKDVGFLLGDIEKKKAQSLVEHFGLSTLPTCMLFNQGKEVARVDSVSSIPLYKMNFRDFMYKHLEQELEELIDRREDMRKAQIKERIARYRYYGWNPYGGAYWGPGWAGYNPYWRRGWGYGYGYGGYAGFGVYF
jgi:hypothetical protein